MLILGLAHRPALPSAAFADAAYAPAVVDECKSASN